MHSRVLVLAAALIVAPFGARGADLVVWWGKGYYPQEDKAVREIITAFEQDTGKRVELVLPPNVELFRQAEAALKEGHPPDFVFGDFSETWIPQWAYEDRLADLEDALRPALDLFDADVVESAWLFNGRTGRRGLYALPMGRSSNHVHVWNSLLEGAGFTLDDIPHEWDAFWSFWCDQVQPAVRKATGRDDIWGVGLAMSNEDLETQDQLIQFQLAYEAPWVSRQGELQVDNLKVRDDMVRALEAYTKIWRKGCTPPDSISWGRTENKNNKVFLAQTVVMTANATLSIPGGLRATRPEDYQRNVATIDWPKADAKGQPLVIEGFVARAAVFKAGGNPALAQDFVRFLAEEGWLAHWLTFAGDRRLPPMRKLLEQPFWLDTSDPHRMRAAIQMLTRPHLNETRGVRDLEWRSSRVLQENVWGTAVHRVVADGITPEQAVDEAVARIKEILSE